MAFQPGSLVSARGREWVVLPESAEDLLVLRPLGGSDDDIAAVLPAIEDVAPASFPPPDASDLGDQASAALLRAALQIGFTSSTGPFRSLAGLAVEPRSYQLVPLLMALRQETVRLLIADDVGIGKTVEAGLIAAELLAIGDARAMSVLCSPALAEQWQRELREKFGLEAELVLPSTVKRLQRGLVGTETIFERYPVTVVSTDFIKADRRRHEFLRTAPELIIVDEVHTAVADGGPGGKARTQRYELVRALADRADRHLILVSATPHSGKDEAFRNLIGLLHSDLATVDLEQPAGRALLARHFVQRRRADIRRYLDENTPFPKDRETKEVPYALSADYKALFDDVLAYARGSIRTDGTAVQQRVSYWSALALLRALASSPRAAVQTLSTRAARVESAAEADAIGRAVVLDQADDEATEAADATPGADDTETSSREQRLLREFRARAEKLEGKADAKLAVLTKTVKQLLADGFQPIVFCRFIDTAEYVGEHLARELKRNTTVATITGMLPPEERSARINELGEVDGNRVLVATDCLSEGVNLQDQFQAVLHYDLAWNPTRHEQREGRVDRFGQRSDIVRAVTLFGSDNQIDGLVLDVLLRKHAAIRKATGVSVPVPDNNQAVVEALMEGLLLRGHDSYQETLDLGLDAQVQALSREWESAAEREKQSMTKYAQNAIHPEEVAAEMTEIRAGIGTPESVRTFLEAALTSFGSTIRAIDGGITATTGTLPTGLLDALPLGMPDPALFRDDFPVGRGEAVLHRTEPAVAAVANFVLEAALDPGLPEQLRPARRCAAVRTNHVTTRTTLLLVRFRFHLTLPSRAGERTVVAEDAKLLAFEGAPATARWLTDDAVEALTAVRATGNIAAPQAEAFVARTLTSIAELDSHLDDVGDQLAEQIAASHRRVRQASGEIKRGLHVKVERPTDILGVYVLLPEVGA
ncbi:helicase-related protein [Nocardioides sp. ChNu-99]|uniref:helicase-related protein n=1 Tax=Nocardioides sp. ChNu-99 TaxID=2839897 RepID=UPI0024061789|nr:helicase-related protein [Nocardioides sp. ChNu-99]MDF9717348.1 DEAD/DEAH box helicase [Nocardioides sp. ChNu-99]